MNSILEISQMELDILIRNMELLRAQATTDETEITNVSNRIVEITTMLESHYTEEARQLNGNSGASLTDRIENKKKALEFEQKVSDLLEKVSAVLTDEQAMILHEKMEQSDVLTETQIIAVEENLQKKTELELSVQTLKEQKQSIEAELKDLISERPTLEALSKEMMSHFPTYTEEEMATLKANEDVLKASNYQMYRVLNLVKSNKELAGMNGTQFTDEENKQYSNMASAYVESNQKLLQLKLIDYSKKQPSSFEELEEMAFEMQTILKAHEQESKIAVTLLSAGTGASVSNIRLKSISKISQVLETLEIEKINRQKIEQLQTRLENTDRLLMEKNAKLDNLPTMASNHSESKSNDEYLTPGPSPEDYAQGLAQTIAFDPNEKMTPGASPNDYILYHKSNMEKGTTLHADDEYLTPGPSPEDYAQGLAQTIVFDPNEKMTPGPSPDDYLKDKGSQESTANEKTEKFKKTMQVVTVTKKGISKLYGKVKDYFNKRAQKNSLHEYEQLLKEDFNVDLKKRTLQVEEVFSLREDILKEIGHDSKDKKGNTPPKSLNKIEALLRKLYPKLDKARLKYLYEEIKKQKDLPTAEVVSELEGVSKDLRDSLVRRKSLNENEKTVKKDGAKAEDRIIEIEILKRKLHGMVPNSPQILEEAEETKTR